MAQERLHTDPAKFYLMKGFHEGTVFCNSVHVRGVDGTEPVAVGAATQEGSWCWHQLFQFLRQDVPGFANAHISLSPPIVGVRETLKLEGGIASRSLTSRATKIADGIVSCDNLIDEVMRSEADMSHDAAIEKGSHYTIHFRPMIPENVSNPMFAGRILSADPMTFASVYGMSQCMAMGRARGTAAVLALREESTFWSVNVG